VSPNVDTQNTQILKTIRLQTTAGNLRLLKVCETVE